MNDIVDKVTREFLEHVRGLTLQADIDLDKFIKELESTLQDGKEYINLNMTTAKKLYDELVASFKKNEADLSNLLTQFKFNLDSEYSRATSAANNKILSINSVVVNTEAIVAQATLEVRTAAFNFNQYCENQLAIIKQTLEGTDTSLKNYRDEAKSIADELKAMKAGSDRDIEVLEQKFADLSTQVDDFARQVFSSSTEVTKLINDALTEFKQVDFYNKSETDSKLRAMQMFKLTGNDGRGLRLSTLSYKPKSLKDFATPGSYYVTNAECIEMADFNELPEDIRCQLLIEVSAANTIVPSQSAPNHSIYQRITRLNINDTNPPVNAQYFRMIDYSSSSETTTPWVPTISKPATIEEILLGEATGSYISPATLVEAVNGSRSPFIELFGQGSKLTDVTYTDNLAVPIGQSAGTPNGVKYRPYTINDNGTLTINRNVRAKISATSTFVAGNTATKPRYAYLRVLDVSSITGLTEADVEVIQYGSTTVADTTLTYSWSGSGEIILDLKAGWVIKPHLSMNSSANISSFVLKSFQFEEILSDNEKLKVNNLEENPVMRYNDVEAYFNEKYKMATKMYTSGDIIGGAANVLTNQAVGIFKRIGKEVRFWGRINVKATGINATPVFNLPPGFRMGLDYQDTLSQIWNVPLAVGKIQNYTTNLSAGGVIQGGDSQNLIFSSNTTGNHYVSATWFTDDEFPDVTADGVTLSYGAAVNAEFETDPFLRESEIENKLIDERVKHGKQIVSGENRQIVDPASPNFGDFYISDSSKWSSLPNGTNYFTINSAGKAIINMDGNYLVSVQVKRQYRTTEETWHYISLLHKKSDTGTTNSIDLAPLGGRLRNRIKSYHQIPGTFRAGDEIWFKSESSSKTNILQYLNIDLFMMERLGDA